MVLAQGTDTNSAGLKNTVILIIRHAEKPESGFDLTTNGYKRADAYVNYFKNFTVDSQPFTVDHLFAAADSKGSHRPRLTLEPFSKASALTINTNFPSKQYQQLVDAIRTGSYGKHILICWHHEAIPPMVKALGADPDTMFPGGEWPADVYGWVIQLRYDSNGHLEDARRIEENLMPDDAIKPN
ncbi:MAG TPA: flagellar basal body-associated protein FliL [Verrucomicrobiae bacterium]